ncbi:unnamed protein product [Leptosia nina]|uniref:Uncharacterized protein n=1 Tax=Leptosia nina TaxID=320188 RepID=A0AAV1IYH4_9NEOP
MQTLFSHECRLSPTVFLNGRLLVASGEDVEYLFNNSVQRRLSVVSHSCTQALLDVRRTRTAHAPSICAYSPIIAFRRNNGLSAEVISVFYS